MDGVWSRWLKTKRKTKKDPEREVVEKDCRARKLNEDAMDSTCSRWRKLMKLSDDQDGCEWVKVSSGTGQPGQSRTESR